MKRALAVAVAGVALAGLATVLFGERLLLRLMAAQVQRSVSGEAFAEMTGGLGVFVCGAGSPFPDPARAGPCLAVVAGERVMIVDVGSGATRRLAPAGIPVGEVDALFLTHFHSDHIDGLGELALQRWAAGSHATPLPVHGPAGVETVVAGFNLAYAQDFQYRVAHHGPAVIPPAGAGSVARPFPLPAAGEGTVVLEDAGLKVTAFAVEHPPIVPAVGYRFDYAGRSVVITGDTVRSATVQRFATGADLLFHEALHPGLVGLITREAEAAGAANLAQITRDILDYHATPVDAAGLAQAAGVRHLVLYHVVPALPVRPLERIFLDGVDEAFDGDVTVARDGHWFFLPPRDGELEVGMRP